MDEPPSYNLFLLISIEQGLVYFVLAALFVLFTAIASATEAAFFSLHPDDIDRFRDSNDQDEKTIADLQGNPRLLLSTLTAWKYTMISAAAVLYIFYLIQSAVDFTSVTLAGGTFVITLAMTFLGIIIPKIYGTGHNLAITKRMAKVSKRLIKFYRPFLKPLFKVSFRVEEKLEERAEQSTVEELTQVLQLANVNNETTESEKEILEGIVNFGSLSVKQVMRQRGEISFAESSLTYHELLEDIKKSGYSRIPIVQGGLDKVEGVLYIKDLLPFLNEAAHFNWHKLIRPAYFVPESKKLDMLLKDFQEKHVHLALAVDEYGGTSGLITLEDVIEEIIGDINDEFDEVGIQHQKIDDRTFIFDGKTSILEFCKTLNIDPSAFEFVSSEKKSLAGLMLEVSGDLPIVGEPIVVEPFTFIAEKIDHRRIKKIRVHLNEQTKTDQ